MNRPRGLHVRRLAVAVCAALSISPGVRGGAWLSQEHAPADGAFIHAYPALTGDVDGDGLDDIIAVGQGWSGKGLNVRTKISRGDGTWASASQVLGDPASVHTYPTLTGDVNGDGRTDLIFVGQDWSGKGLNIRTKLSKGDGTWTSCSQVLGDGAGVHAYPALAGDVNGDGWCDLVFIGQGWSGKGLNVRTKLSKGNGTWASLSQVLGDGAEVHEHPVLTGDFNGDGKMDLLFHGQNWSEPGLNFRTRLSSGNGTWTTVKSVLGDEKLIHERPPLVGDVNGDGRTDVIFIGQDWDGAGLNVRVKLSSADGTWKGVKAALGDEPCIHASAPRAEDVNGDGRADLVFAGRGCGAAGLEVRAKLSGGDGTWMDVRETIPEADGTERQSLAGDLDGDGRKDLLLLRQGSKVPGLVVRSLSYIGPRARLSFAGFEKLALDQGVSSAALEAVRESDTIDLDLAVQLLGAFGSRSGLVECDPTVFRESVALATRDHTLGDGGGASLPPCTIGPPEHTLVNGMTLPAIAGNEEVEVLLNPPPFFPLGFTAEVASGQLPAGLTHLTDGRQVLLRGWSAPDARTSTFTLRLRDGATGAIRADYRITQPVLLGIHRLGRDDNVFPTIVARLTPDPAATPSTGAQPTFFGSGNATATRPMSWAYLPGTGSPPLSAVGYMLSPLPDGNLGLGGVVSPGAYSSFGRFRLTQNGVSVFRGASFEVNVHFLSQPGLEKRSFQRWVLPPMQLAKYTPFHLDLPAPFGGDGTFYAWSDPDQDLPAGLVLTNGPGGQGSVAGSLLQSVPLGSRSIRLRAGSTSGHAATLQIDLEVLPLEIGTFDVWTQNTLLRPPSLPGEILAALFGIFWFQPWIPGAISLLWSDTIDNTDHDNAQRTERILAQLNDRRTPYPLISEVRRVPFDLVALQEAFDDDSRQYLDQNAALHTKHWGPPRDGFEDNSGLLLLVRRGWTVLNHWHEAFQATPGLDAAVTGSSVEGLVQKGFSLTQIQVGGPGDYFYVVNTHTQSLVEHAAMRADQLRQIRAFIDAHTDAEHPVLILGDFNVIGETTEHADMLRILGYPYDLYREMHPSAASHPGYTSDTTRNAYAHYWFGGSGEPPQQRLDYMLVRQGSRYELLLDEISVVEYHRETSHYSSNGWSALGHLSYISDHWGLKGKLTLVHN